ncbi:MAG: hypothetical protein ABJB76_02700 [Candidatus Nitrosocosmicus sp.]
MRTILKKNKKEYAVFAFFIKGLMKLRRQWDDNDREHILNENLIFYNEKISLPQYLDIVKVVPVDERRNFQQVSAVRGVE